MFGYIDAASGGMLVAAAAGGVAGARVMLRNAWTTRKGKGKGSPAPDRETGADQDPDLDQV